MPVATTGTSAEGKPHVDDDDRVQCSSQMPDEAFSESPCLRTIQKQANGSSVGKDSASVSAKTSEAMPRDQLCVKCSIVAVSQSVLLKRFP